MRTTLDLPEDVMRDVKIRAVHERRKLKDVVAELIRHGLRSSHRAAQVSDKIERLPVSSARGGVQRGVKLNDSPALLRQMER